MTSQALAQLFAQYGDDVYRLAYSYTRHPADSEDICRRCSVVWRKAVWS